MFAQVCTMAEEISRMRACENIWHKCVTATDYNDFSFIKSWYRTNGLAWTLWEAKPITEGLCICYG